MPPESNTQFLERITALEEQLNAFENKYSAKIRFLEAKVAQLLGSGMVNLPPKKTFPLSTEEELKLLNETIDEDNREYYINKMVTLFKPAGVKRNLKFVLANDLVLNYNELKGKKSLIDFTNLFSALLAAIEIADNTKTPLEVLQEALKKQKGKQKVNNENNKSPPKPLKSEFEKRINALENKFKDLGINCFEKINCLEAKVAQLDAEITGDNPTPKDTFPISTDAQLQQLEDTINDENREKVIKEMVTLLKPAGVKSNLQFVLANELVLNYNINGLQGKKRLKSFNKVFSALLAAIEKSDNTTNPKEILEKALVKPKAKHRRDSSK